jgi:hypothetical protein
LIFFMYLPRKLRKGQLSRVGDVGPERYSIVSRERKAERAGT